MKKLLKKLAKHYFQKFCEHSETEIIFDDYQERYRKEKCQECGKIIYRDL